MATITKGLTFGSTETVTNTKLHTLVDSATITDIVNADVSAGAAIVASKLDLTGSGFLTTGAAFTITGVYTFTTAPVMSSVDINGGTLDGVQIGGTTATGELIVNNASDEADGLGSQGTSGQVLTSAGTGVNPTFETVGISQGDLNTAMGEVSSSVNLTSLILPGGTYGFYPQIKASNTNSCGVGIHADLNTGRALTTSYVTRITVYTNSNTIYAQQRYITASGHDHWIFLLVDKTTKQVIGGYQAPDHPSANQGGATEIEISHPFGSYDLTKHEIIVVDNADLPAMRQGITRKKSLLTVINEDYIIDDTERPLWTPREIIKIDEYGDIEGEIVKTLRTSEWAKIMIGAPEITLKRKVVETLPSNILFKKMRRI